MGELLVLGEELLGNGGQGCLLFLLQLRTFLEALEGELTKGSGTVPKAV